MKKHPLSESYDILHCRTIDEFQKNLEEAIKHPKVRTIGNLEDKHHLRYFRNYLFKEKKGGLRVQTMVVEKNYISLTFLSDYLNYYANTYHDYIKQCRRVHFFTEKITDKEFQEIILHDNDPKNKWASYVGNVVIKPLPKGFIGATLLKHYTNKPFRFYPAVKEYEVNLFGKKSVVETMQYQEQDGVVGSCGSFALSFAAQITSELFKTAEPSPSEITIMAGPDSNGSGKHFPSTDLDSDQICTAITELDLNPEGLAESLYLGDSKWLRANIYAYLKMGIPVLFAIDLELKGHHLVTINGYRFDDKFAQTENTLDNDQSLFKIAMISDSIIKFYAHDDQIGPFARITFLNNSNYQFDTSWWTDSEDDKKVLKGNGLFMITPLLKSLKVDFRSIFEHVKVLNFIFKVQMDLYFEWDIYLDKSNHYKDELRTSIIEDEVLTDKDDLSVLFQSLPQYIWVVKGYVFYGGKKALMFDFIYDASDINFAHHTYYASVFNEALYQELLEYELLGLFNSNNAYKNHPTPELFTELLEQDELIGQLEEVEDEIKSETDGALITPQILFERLARKSGEVTQGQIDQITEQTKKT